MAQSWEVFTFATGSLNRPFFSDSIQAWKFNSHSAGKGDLGKILGLNKNKCNRRLEK